MSNRPGSRAADRAPGASSPRHAKPAESRLGAGTRSRLKAGSAPARRTGTAGFPAGSPPTRLDAASAAS
ncbi:hypothetical protein, partial [Thiohalocapsa sp. ML1]|uniref:hypothetical protein n=1 Tax=Thiohalocapsa sp. ML1 TaxID=1431688 RepID=UPI001C1FFA31